MKRNHTPYEASEVECRDCFSPVIDADEEYCDACGEPLCLDCSRVVNDEPLCNGCFSAMRKQALKRLQNDPLVGDLFQEAA